MSEMEEAAASSISLMTFRNDLSLSMYTGHAWTAATRIFALAGIVEKECSGGLPRLGILKLLTASSLPNHCEL